MLRGQVETRERVVKERAKNQDMARWIPHNNACLLGDGMQCFRLTTKQAS